jgi:hypothetical protein
MFVQIKKRMKKVLQFAVILMAFVPAIAFGQSQKLVWPELKAFHELMSASFHPAEEGNFAPLKANADNLFATAKSCQKSVIPQDQFKLKETKEALRKLVIECGAVQKAVIANRTDTELMRLLSQAHSTFHTIMGECRQQE